MYKVTCEDSQVLKSISMDVYYLFDRNAQTFFSANGQKLPSESLWFNTLTDKALKHIKTFPVNVRKQRMKG